MGKKKAVKPWRAAAEQPAQPNAFERIYNRKKFDVLGKKQKGERKHGKARSDAVTKVSIPSQHAPSTPTARLVPPSERLTTCAEKEHAAGGVQRHAKVQCLCGPALWWWAISAPCASSLPLLTSSYWQCPNAERHTSVPDMSARRSVHKSCMLCAEEDSSLTAEDRAIARFQKQRMKELKGAYHQQCLAASCSNAGFASSKK